ncbi:MAG: DUF2478 domain-containing protein [Parvibaculum sp.]|nr:DUF2478 domain-containing protein [Parvibaculum sp.]
MAISTASSAGPGTSAVKAFPIAAIIHAEHGVTDGILAEFAFTLRASGRRVQGLVQQFMGGTGKEATVLVDLDRGTCFPLFQKLGAGAGACSIDQGGVAAASVVLRRALNDKPDLVAVNRFGALEAGGGGFADEMLALMSEGIPLLTIVAESYRLDWRHFTGGAGVELEPNLNALEAWFAGLQANGASE